MRTDDQRPSARRRAWAAARAAAVDPVTMRLQDGRRARLRPVRPDDKQRLVALLEAMSPRSRRMRFHSMRTGFSDGELRYLTELDGRHHFAWIAVDADDPDGPAIGEVRCVRERGGTSLAELAIAVADGWQGVGLGTKLVEALQLAVAEHGITRLTGHLLPENVGGQHLFRRLGAGAGRLSQGVVVKEIPLERMTRSVRRSSPAA